MQKDLLEQVIILVGYLIFSKSIRGRISRFPQYQRLNTPNNPRVANSWYGLIFMIHGMYQNIAPAPMQMCLRGTLLKEKRLYFQSKSQ